MDRMDREVSAAQDSLVFGLTEPPETCPTKSIAIVARLGRLFTQPELQFLGAEPMGQHASVQPAVLIVLGGPSHADQERLGAAFVQRFNGEQGIYRKLAFQAQAKAPRRNIDHAGEFVEAVRVTFGADSRRPVAQDPRRCPAFDCLRCRDLDLLVRIVQDVMHYAVLACFFA